MHGTIESVFRVEWRPLAELASKGADVLLNINASPFCPGKRRERDEIIRRHLAVLRRPLAYINTTGAADNGKRGIGLCRGAKQTGGADRQASPSLTTRA